MIQVAVGSSYTWLLTDSKLFKSWIKKYVKIFNLTYDKLSNLFLYFLCKFWKKTYFRNLKSSRSSAGKFSLPAIASLYRKVRPLLFIMRLVLSDTSVAKVRTIRPRGELFRTIRSFILIVIFPGQIKSVEAMRNRMRKLMSSLSLSVGNEGNEYSICSALV